MDMAILRERLSVQAAAIGGVEQQAADFAKVLTAMTFWAENQLDAKSKAADVRSWYDSLDSFLADLRIVKPVQKSLVALISMMAAGVSASAESETHMQAIGSWLATADKRLEHMPDVNRLSLMAIRRCAQYFRSGSTNSAEWLRKNAAKISPSFRSDVADEAIDGQMSKVILLVDLIEELTGRRDIKLSELEKEKLRVDNAAEYQQILALRKDILAVSKQYIRVQVRKAGGLIKYSQMLEMLREAYVFHDLPKAEGWDGYIDEEGKLYTLQKKEIKGKPGFPIIGNPEYNPKTNDTFVFSVVTSMGNTQYFYTVDSLEGWREERFEAVDDFAPMVSKVREKWLRDIKSSTNKTQVLAILCEILYWTSGRIGATKNNVRGAQTFGVSTLQGRHCQRQGSNLVLDYIGKTGVHQRHVLKPVTQEQKLVATQLLKWAKAAGEDGYVFDLVEGRHTTPPTNSTVNAYFKSKGATVTVHKLRHARAAGIMDRLMRDKKSCPFFRYKGDERELIVSKKPTPQAAEQNYKDLATEVGKELGHTAGEKVTWSTAAQNYIPPQTTLSFFQDAQVRIPAWAERLKTQKLTD